MEQSPIQNNVRSVYW